MTRPHAPRGRLWTVPALALLAAGMTALQLTACSSDEFGLVGSQLPITVTQDSLAVADTLFGAVTEAKVIPATAEPFIQREIVYLGTQASAGWRGTPLLRFNFNAPSDTINVLTATWTRVRLQVRMLAKDAARGITRSLAIYALRDTLNAGLADSSLAAVLGDSLQSATDILGGQTVFIPLDEAVVRGWIQAKAHTGIALVDRTTLPLANLVGLASKQIAHVSLLGDEIPVGETVTPQIVIELPDTEHPTVAYPISEDLTHFVQPADPPGETRLGLSAHVPARTWLRFDVSGIDPTATINRALLVLPMDSTLTIGTQLVDLAAYRSTLATASTAGASGLEQVLGGLAQVNLDTADRVEVNITEFIQRQVNGVLGADDGVLVALDSEVLELASTSFYGTAFSDPLRRPRLELLVTPPAKYGD